ncbi:MAG: alpha/beta fold hydrolase [Planctomycetes bacterium]|nr:alpha/beta fold hydrolase [Planctomycetota bacterium]
MRRRVVAGVGVAEWPGRAPAVVALHGFTGGGADFLGLAPRLGRRVVALDLVGHGLSPAPVARAPYALDRQLGRLGRALDRLGLEACVLLGYSLGARVALHLALRRRVLGLVLIGGTPGLTDEAERTARREEDARRAAAAARDGVRAFLAAWRAQPLIATQARAPAWLQGAMRRGRARLTAHGLARTLEALSPGALPPLWDALPTLTAPTLLVTGEGDARFEPVARAMRERLPRARHAAVPGAGHAPHLERPAACARVVRRWLANPDGRATER